MLAETNRGCDNQWDSLQLKNCNILNEIFCVDSELLSNVSSKTHAYGGWPGIACKLPNNASTDKTKNMLV